MPHIFSPNQGNLALRLMQNSRCRIVASRELSEIIRPSRPAGFGNRTTRANTGARNNGARDSMKDAPVSLNPIRPLPFVPAR